MLKVLFTIAIGCSLASTQSRAEDATWFCSAIIDKLDPKPWAFKYAVKGTELIDLEVEMNRLITAQPMPQSETSKKVEPLTTKYTIVEDTSIGLVAVHSDIKGEDTAQVILINKTSGKLMLADLTTKEKPVFYEGTCQVGK